MLYERSDGFIGPRGDGTDDELRALLDDLAVLLDAGVVALVRDRDGQLRLAPADGDDAGAGA